MEHTVSFIDMEHGYIFYAYNPQTSESKKLKCLTRPRYFGASGWSFEASDGIDSFTISSGNSAYEYHTIRHYETQILIDWVIVDYNEPSIYGVAPFYGSRREPFRGTAVDVENHIMMLSRSREGTLLFGKVTYEYYPWSDNWEPTRDLVHIGWHEVTASDGTKVFKPRFAASDGGQIIYTDELPQESSDNVNLYSFNR